MRRIDVKRRHASIAVIVVLVWAATSVRSFATFSISATIRPPRARCAGSRCLRGWRRIRYAIPGIGAVATQAAANRLYGPEAIKLLEQGLSPAEVVKRIRTQTRAAIRGRSP